MSLCDTHHQGYAQRLIQRAFAQDRLPHAYLFHGPDGVGKEALALGLAELLLCSSPIERKLEEEEAAAVGANELRVGCGACEDCRAVASRTHPDLHLIYRQLNREHPDPVVRKRKAFDIGVDVLRHFVIASVALTPIRGRAKIFIIREADRITPQAQNALLKTLEEPPGTTFIMLLVTALDRLLPTTLSRCQVVRFDALPPGFIRIRLREKLPDVPGEQVEWYARASDGSLGRALQFAEDALYGLNQRLLDGLIGVVRMAEPSGAGGRRAGRTARPAPSGRSDRVAAEWLEESKALGDRYRKRDPDITDTEASRRGLQSIFQLAATWYADVLRVISGDDSRIVNAQGRTQIEEVSASFDSAFAVEAINRIARAEHQLDLNANTQLCVETLLNDLARSGIPAASG